MNRTIPCVALAVGLLLPRLLPAQGTLFVSNLGQASTGSGAVASDAWIAQRIFTGMNAGGYSLNSIQLLMGPASGNPTDFSVSIYSSLSGVPGSSVASLSGSDPAAGGTFNYAASAVTLLPLTGYFIVATGATPVARGSYTWAAANMFTQGADRWEIEDIYYSSTNGVSWVSHVRQNVFQVAVYGDPVPEPSVAALILIGGWWLLYARRRTT